MSRYCPICEQTSEKFKSFGYIPRDDAMCPTCGAVERHRLSWLFLEKRITSEYKNKKMLHIAPENVFKKKFRAIFGEENYITADLTDKSVKVQMDITNIFYPAESFDCIFCSHVLEHILDDKKAMKELYRVLKNDGWAILLVPIVAKEKTEEDFSIVTKEDRMKHYGDPDHVRNYGVDYKERLEECGWCVEVVCAKDFLDSEQIRVMGITQASGDIYFCTKNTQINDVS